MFLRAINEFRLERTGDQCIYVAQIVLQSACRKLRQITMDTTRLFALFFCFVVFGAYAEYEAARRIELFRFKSDVQPEKSIVEDGQPLTAFRPWKEPTLIGAMVRKNVSCEEENE